MKWINFVNYWTGPKLLTIKQRERVWCRSTYLAEIDRDIIKYYIENGYGYRPPKKILDKKLISRIISLITHPE